MRKTIPLLTAVVFFASTGAFAGESNVISISDLKEATYHLILDVKDLKKASQKRDEEYLDFTKHELERSEAFVNEMKRVVEGQDKNISGMKAQLDAFKERAVYIKQGDDKFDRFIRKYVAKNEALAEEVK